MRPFQIVIFVACIQSCEQKPHAKNNDDLAATWSADGKTMVITRKGVMIASFRDSTDACFVQLYGPDGIVDADVSYYEELTTGRVSERKNVILSWSQPDESIKTMVYDTKGDIVTPDTISESK